MTALLKQVARPLAKWTEEDGNVLWWAFPVTEQPWLGSPLSLGYTVELHTQDSLHPRIAARCTIGGWPGYHTHWTPPPPAPEPPADWVEYAALEERLALTEEERERGRALHLAIWGTEMEGD